METRSRSCFLIPEEEEIEVLAFVLACLQRNEKKKKNESNEFYHIEY